MIRLQQVKLPIGHTKRDLEKKIIKQLRIPPRNLLSVQIRKQSIDARKKQELTYIYTVDVKITNEEEVLKRSKGKWQKASDVVYHFPQTGTQKLLHPPVIIGAGPAGLFCAYMLASHGYAPIIIERGPQVEQRSLDVAEFWKTGVLKPNSNVQFGEGGAGTFSDGKLNTLVKDHFGRNRKVLDLFIQAGAPQEIAYTAKPHIGTDILCGVVQKLREEIIAMGGTFYFNTCMTDIHYADKRLKGITVEADHKKREIETEILVLAIGHSARDTFELLAQRQIPMEAKSFAVGFRVEHPQQMMNDTQYGTSEAAEKLPAAPYKVTAHAKNGRGIYSFCMCPGGYVVNASSEEHRLAINGMSYYKRDSKNANSAIIVSVTPDDYPGDGPLFGIAFQRELEQKAYELGEGRIPQQLYGDFQADRVSTGYGEFSSMTKGKVKFANLRHLFSDGISEAFIEGMEQFGHKIPQFDRADAILSGVESRTSSPVRIPRDKQFESEVRGIYPCGEGAGYAGGIMSAAMDGLKVAEAIASHYKP